MATRKILLGRYVILILFCMFNIIRSEGDVAAYKPAEQSSNNNSILVASKAVDECIFTQVEFQCCAVTNTTGQKTVWWRVDLLELMTINWISVFFTDGFQHKLAGYQLYASNTTTSPTDGVLCYGDNSTTESDVQLVAHHTCPYVARYVTIYNYRNDPKRYDWYSDYAVLELCEVKVKGCPVGSHGYGNCESRCSGECYGGNCHSTSGDCFYCYPGKYGVRCQNSCSMNCKDNMCSIDSGYCSDCVPGKFGNTCEQNCSVNCLDRLCAKDTGECFECIAGKYGIACDEDCPNSCDRITGIYIAGVLPMRAEGTTSEDYFNRGIFYKNTLNTGHDPYGHSSRVTSY